MADMRINRVPGEYAAPDYSSKRAQNNQNTSFADLLKSVGSASGAEQDRGTIPQRTSADGAPVPSAHVYMRDASGWLGKVSVPDFTPSAPQTAVVLEKLEGESNEDWQRRCIAFETSRRWQTNSRAWKAESAGMDFVDGIAYCDEKAVQWVTDLMESEPAMFREWLDQEKWHIEESGLDNAILPNGFTEEDMSRWMEKDVLEYL